MTFIYFKFLFGSGARVYVTSDCYWITPTCFLNNTINKLINLINDKIVTSVVIAYRVRYIIDVEISEKLHNKTNE
jgi:hypothetical protein